MEGVANSEGTDGKEGFMEKMAPQFYEFLCLRICSYAGSPLLVMGFP